MPILKAYPAGSDEEALESAASLGSDLFIAYATWKWIEMQRQTGGSPVYRYRFDRKMPIAPDTKVNGVAATANDIGARHAGEIEYVFGALDSVPHVTWEEADRKLSDLDDVLLVELRPVRRSERPGPAEVARATTRRPATR